jgi:hypothetical protein
MLGPLLFLVEAILVTTKLVTAEAEKMLGQMGPLRTPGSFLAGDELRVTGENLKAAQLPPRRVTNL